MRPPARPLRRPMARLTVLLGDAAEVGVCAGTVRTSSIDDTGIGFLPVADCASLAVSSVLTSLASSADTEFAICAASLASSACAVTLSATVSIGLDAETFAARAWGVVSRPSWSITGWSTLGLSTRSG